MTAAPEPLVSEERIAELAWHALRESGRLSIEESYKLAIRTAIREAGEAAAKVADARVDECGYDPWTADAKAEARYLAAEIRKRLP